MFESVAPIPWAESQLWGPEECGSECDPAPTFIVHQQGDCEHPPCSSGLRALGPARREQLLKQRAGARRPAQCSALMISFNCYDASFHRQNLLSLFPTDLSCADMGKERGANVLPALSPHQLLTASSLRTIWEDPSAKLLWGPS